MNFASKIKRIVIVGAFDRHNYGDLLFPIIIEAAAFKRGFTGAVECFSTLKSDLTKFGAKPTKSLRSLFAQSNGSDTLVVVGGGEVLSATWPTIISYLCPPKLGAFVSRIARGVGFRIPAFIFSRLMGVPSVLPFVYSNDDFLGALVAYNAVGGSHLATERDISLSEIVATKLKAASYISVRDRATKKIFDRMNVGDIQLSPDCAVLLSDLFPIHELSSKVDDELKALCSSFGDGYICFQSALMYVIGEEQAIAETIVQLQERSGLGVVIFAIGRATGHSDQDAATAIFQHISGNLHIKVVDTKSIYEIMYVIARSKAYIGSSLHGAITALSYAVPHVGLCPRRVQKLATFIESWCPKDSSAISEYGDLIEHTMRVIAAPKNDLVDVSVELKIKADENFDRLFSIG